MSFGDHDLLADEQAAAPERPQPERQPDGEGVRDSRIAAALRSLAKAYPYLVAHADHIDGEFSNALGEVTTALAAAEARAAQMTGEAEAERRACDRETQRANAAEARAARLAERVEWAAGVFDHYAILHYAKRTEDGDRKGDVNAGYARSMRAALAPEAP